MKKQIFLTISILLIVLIGCNKQDQGIDNKIPVCDYEEFALVLKNDLTQIGSLLRDAESDFTNKKAVLKSAETYYNDSSEEFMKFSHAFNEKLIKGLSKSNLNSLEKEIVQDVEDAILYSLKFEDFHSFLDDKIYELMSSEIDNERINNVLIYLASVKASIEFVHENQDLFPLSDSFTKSDPDEEESWWERWGRCAAAIAGGALTGAGSGILGGAAVGTVVLPLVGTVSGAVVGGAVLGIGGGLTGAAAGC